MLNNMASKNCIQDPKLKEIINLIAEREKYVTCSVTNRNPSNDGYTGNVLALDIRGKTELEDKETNIFLKQMLHPKIKMIYDVPNIYKREKFVYSDLFRAFYDLQEAHNVPEIERFDVAKAFDVNNEEIIVLENLSARGFKTYSNLEIVNLEFAELALQALAKFHGLSLALETIRPDYFNTKVKTMNCVYIFDKYFHDFQHNIRRIAMKFLPEEEKNELTPKLIDVVNKYKMYMTEESCSVKTVCHGDFRPSNIMVKEYNGKPSKVIPVDYQITFYGSPVLDFIYFIFWSTDQQFRHQHLEHLKKIYHQHLGKFLYYISIDVENVFPKEDFEKEWKKKLDFGLMISLFYLPFLFPKTEDVPNFEETVKALDELELKVDEKFGDRLRGIIDDFIKWGYL